MGIRKVQEGRIKMQKQKTEKKQCKMGMLMAAFLVASHMTPVAADPVPRNILKEKMADSHSGHKQHQRSAVRPEQLTPYSKRPITEDVIYLIMPDRFNNGDTTNDRGGIKGSHSDHGFRPDHKAYYHGGDMKGITEKLDYLADMGVSAIWFTPVFKNKPVSIFNGKESSGYHGYWPIDYTQIDPHMGTNDDLKTLVAEAHKRNMKVIFDIITNHTADVIQFQECIDKQGHSVSCQFRSTKDFPFSRSAVTGKAINKGFKGDAPAHQTVENFKNLTDFTYAYTPFINKGDENIRKPDWLNDMRMYHHRGDSFWQGESNLYGDFFGLDDINTEHPTVLNGFIDIYKYWISEFKLDGFRIDTVKHVGDAFWQKFTPAIMDHAKKEGIENFYILGEVHSPDPELLSHYTKVAKLPTVLDFGFRELVTRLIAEGHPTKQAADFFAQDHLYRRQDQDTSYDERILPTFFSNHDVGRLGHFITKDMTQKGGKIDDVVRLKKLKLANAMMMFARGVPVVYYGDEQGFTGDSNDMDARENMFPSRVASYNDNQLIGTQKTTTDDNFTADHPLYQDIQKLVQLKRQHPVLQNGYQKVLKTEDQSGLLAFERFSKGGTQAGTDRMIIILNTSGDARSMDAGLIGEGQLCKVAGSADMHYGKISVPAYGWVLYQPQACDQATQQ